MVMLVWGGGSGRNTQSESKLPKRGAGEQTDRERGTGSGTGWEAGGWEGLRAASKRAGSWVR